VFYSVYKFILDILFTTFLFISSKTSK